MEERAVLCPEALLFGPAGWAGVKMTRHCFQPPARTHLARYSACLMVLQVTEIYEPVRGPLSLAKTGAICVSDNDAHGLVCTEFVFEYLK